MLAQPFLCALILAREWSWYALPAAAAAAAVFLVRIPLITLARQRWVWTAPHPETALAWRWLAGLGAALLVCAAVLAQRWPIALLLGCGALATALTTFAVWMTVRNRQRSVALQVVSAAGLTGSCAAACLSVLGTMPGWGWWLWGLSAAHAAAGILVVHARLEARIAARKKLDQPNPWRKPALIAQAVLLVLAPVAALRSPWLGAALALSAVVHLRALARLAETVDTPLTTVGLRALGLSCAVSALLILGLW